MEMEKSWMDLGMVGPDSLNCNQIKRKMKRVTLEQKELFVDFISENPEMITHSSTRESEKVLWDELVGKLNNMKPEKKYDFWKIFWNKWIKGLNDKPDNSLTILDYKLKKFLINLGFNSGSETKEKKEKSNSTIAEINESLKKVKEERSKNKLEMDNLDYTIVKLKNQINEIKNQLKEKRRLNSSLEQKKNYLITKKRKLEAADIVLINTSIAYRLQALVQAVVSRHFKNVHVFDLDYTFGMHVIRINVKNVVFIILAILSTTIRQVYTGHGSSHGVLNAYHVLSIKIASMVHLTRPIVLLKAKVILILLKHIFAVTVIKLKLGNTTVIKKIHAVLFHLHNNIIGCSNCTVKSDILCLGRRKFLKNLPCNWTGGYKWSTALILSITLGGFGADRFYLGHWQEGIGKLFSFGGLGVWTLIDVMLISMRYLGPADGSLYI
ncbi:hypothetical protein TSAR_015196 [Trichomalopsis sarcophagae]|uniref:TM2 domain-containing protein n=1 Tax=Trichomalopsis sarcophagae TaxID=543379 RepID=A0A232EPM7_9HYME|nr:hypothetical protein TSAR_015196 [Trichomalopsis sarcophagae]